jgi:hypothetical protein
VTGVGKTSFTFGRDTPAAKPAMANGLMLERRPPISTSAGRSASDTAPRSAYMTGPAFQQLRRWQVHRSTGRSRLCHQPRAHCAVSVYCWNVTALSP